MINLEKIKKIYFVGIKGVGMSALASIFKNAGFSVLGSDVNQKFFTDEVLKKEGIKFHNGFDVNNLKKFNPDLVIYSSAHKENKELEKAKELEIPAIDYGQGMSLIFNKKFGIAVCGSHGKTTVSALLGQVLEEAKLDPTVLVGSRVEKWKASSRIGESNIMVAEVDEYQNKLKNYFPNGVVLLNVDFDHPDFFKSKKEYDDVFIKFISKIPRDGFLVANFDDKKVRKMAGRVKCEVISFGLESGEFQAKKIKYISSRKIFQFEVWQGEKNMGKIETGLIGEHNVLNILSVISTSLKLGVDFKSIKRGISLFKGTKRRMEFKGEVDGVKVIDDYAHHPAEIKATLSAIRNVFPKKRIICIFQPHTFSRTKSLLNDFAKSFVEVDSTIILDIDGSAREKSGDIHSLDLVKKAKKFSNIKYISNFDETIDFLKSDLERGDILITMGAGNVWQIGEDFLNLK